MYSGNSRRSSRSQSQSSKNILVIVAIIVVVFFVIKMLGKENTPTQQTEMSSMSITPQENSRVYISPDGEKRVEISNAHELYTNDAYVLVESGNAIGTFSGVTVDIDENAQLSFRGESQTGGTFLLTSGRIWVDGGENGTILEMTNMNVQIPSGGIILAEKSRSEFDTVYAIKGDTNIITPIGQYTLKSLERITLSTADINSTQTRLPDLIHSIDESIIHNTLFIRNNGTSYLSASDSETLIENSASGNLLGNTGENLLGSRYISIAQPVDGSTVKTRTITVMGDIHSEDVRRVTIDDIDTSVSPVNQNFILQEFTLKDEINNIVYKAYDTENNMLEKGVLVVYGPKNTNTVSTLVPQNSPISSKDFVIQSPSGNPYTTTEDYVRVQGTVPANTVQYIVVNDFRLQKYVPNSTTWYYHANAAIGTMKDGMNLYTIKFYDANNNLLYTQLFTIIKDAKNSSSDTAE